MVLFDKRFRIDSWRLKLSDYEYEIINLEKLILMQRH